MTYIPFQKLHVVFGSSGEIVKKRRTAKRNKADRSEPSSLKTESKEKREKREEGGVGPKSRDGGSAGIRDDDSAAARRAAFAKCGADLIGSPNLWFPRFFKFWILEGGDNTVGRHPN